MENKNLTAGSFVSDNNRLLHNTALIVVAVLMSSLFLIFFSSQILYLAFAVTGLIFLLIALTNLEIAIYILIFSVPFSSGLGFIPSYISVGPATLKFSYLMISLTALVLFFQLLAGKRRWIKTRLDVLLVLFLAICFLSIFISVDIGLSIKEFMQITSFILLVFLISNVLTSERSLRNAGAVFISTVGLAAFLGITGLTGQYAAGTEFETTRTVVGFSDPNLGASLLVGTIPLVISYIFDKNISAISKVYYIAVGALLIVSLGFSYSRTGWLLGLLVIILSFLVLGKLRSLLILVPVIGMMIVALQTLPNFGERAAQFGTDTSSSQRYYLWTAAINIAQENPVLGIGVGAFPSYLYQNQNEFLGDRRFTINKYAANWAYNTKSRRVGMVAHNAILQMWAEVGTAGVSVFLLLIFLLLASIVKKAFKPPERTVSWFIMVGASIGFLGVLAQNLTISDLIEHFWVLMAISVAASGLFAKSVKEGVEPA